MTTWGGRVAKFKKIEYLFKRAKPNKARRVTSFSLGKAMTIDYAILEGVACAEAVLNGLPVDDQIRRLTEDCSPRTNPATYHLLSALTVT